jgi:hypothetical protein
MEDLARNIIRKHISDMNAYKGGSTSDTYQRPLMAEIQLIIADEQAKSAERLEQQTATLIKLTRGLFCLTWILVGLTAGLLVFTYFLVKFH